MKNSFWKRLLSGFRVKTSTPIGTFTNADFPGIFPFGFQQASEIDNNTIIVACMAWIGRTFPEANFRVMRPVLRDGIESEEVVTDHALTRLVLRPNPNYSRSLLWQAVAPHVALSGDGYIKILRGAGDLPTQLYWLPSFAVNPVTKQNSRNFIDYYEFKRSDGTTEDIDPRYMIHLRDGLDPKDPRHGLSKVKALLTEVLTDNEAALYIRYILENMGTTSVVFAPETSDVLLDEDQAKLIARMYQQQTTGRNRGKASVLTAPMKMLQGGMNPSQVLLDKVRRIPEERITAVFGIPAIVAGMGAGLERSTMANYRESREQATESLLVPMWRNFAEQMDIQALPLFGRTAAPLRCDFDYSGVRSFQEDENKKHERIRNNWTSGMWTLGQCADAGNFEIEDADRKLRVFDLQSGLAVTEQAKAKIRLMERARVGEAILESGTS